MLIWVASAGLVVSVHYGGAHRGDGGTSWKDGGLSTPPLKQNRLGTVRSHIPAGAGNAIDRLNPEVVQPQMSTPNAHEELWPIMTRSAPFMN